MSYPMDLDEYDIQRLTKELHRRLQAQADSLCDYCGRGPETETCRFPERHKRVRAFVKITITPAMVEWGVKT